MGRSDRAIPEGDAANLERLRQVTARIRARAAELGKAAGPRLPAPARRPRAPTTPRHWSDGPLVDADGPEDEG